MSDDPLLKEYYAIVDIVSDFDRRLVTVKGWSVTLSLAAIGFGLEKHQYGYFLLAVVSSFAFWCVEFVMKRHQMRYYFRMSEIESIRYEKEPAESKDASSPRIDSSWSSAHNRLIGKATGPSPIPKRRGQSTGYRWIWASPHVSFPHIISVVLGIVLFILGWMGYLAGYHSF